MKLKLPSFLIALSIIAILIPSVYILSLILQAGELPNFDYWWITRNFYSVDGFSTNPSHWIFRANEHFLLIPSLLYAVNIIITKGSNIGLCLITWIFAVIQSDILIALLPLNKLRRSRRLFFLIILCISIFTFTPAAAHNWMRGFSGVAWIGANLFVISSIFCLKKMAETSRFYWVIWSIIFALFATITYSTSLALWPILCIVPVLFRWPLKIIISYISVAFFVIATYFLTYKTPSTSPSLSKLKIGDVITYIPTYLSGIFTNNITLGAIIAIVGLITTIALGIYWLKSNKKNRRIDWLPWLSIQVYALGTALMAAVSRSGFGVEQATSSRYASLPALFWMSHIILIVLLVREWQPIPRNQSRWLTGFFAVITIGIISMYQIGKVEAAAIAHRASYQPLVALSVQLGISDATLIKERVGNKPAAFIGLIEALKKNGLVPFNRDIKSHNFCASLDQKIEPYLLSPPQEGIPGYFDNITQFTPTASRVMGWVGDPENKVKCIAILNQDNVVRGFAMSGFYRDDIAKLFGPSYQLSGWKGYIEIAPTDQKFTAYTSLKNREGWIALHSAPILGKN